MPAPREIPSPPLSEITFPVIVVPVKLPVANSTPLPPLRSMVFSEISRPCTPPGAMTPLRRLCAMVLAVIVDPV